MDRLGGADLGPLTSERELALAQRIGEFPEVVAEAARELSPHSVAFYLRNLAADFHSYYNAERILVDDEACDCAACAVRGSPPDAGQRAVASRRQCPGEDVNGENPVDDPHAQALGRQLPRRHGRGRADRPRGLARHRLLPEPHADPVHDGEAEAGGEERRAGQARRRSPGCRRAARRRRRRRPEKPKFDFYRILPGVGRAGDREGASASAARAQERPQQQSTGSARRTFISSRPGSFQNPADADNQKARLAILGFESSVEPANLPDKGTWYRVRMGPYAKVEEINKVRQALAQNGIDANLIKVKDQQ